VTKLVVNYTSAGSCKNIARWVTDVNKQRQYSLAVIIRPIVRPSLQLSRTPRPTFLHPIGVGAQSTLGGQDILREKCV